MAKPTLADLRSKARGQVVAKHDADYETAREVYDGMIDRQILKKRAPTNIGGLL